MAPELTEQAIKDKYHVEIFKPKACKATGITVFLPGEHVPLQRYSSMTDTLVSCKQVVIAFKHLNAFPLCGKSHKRMAEDVRDVFKDYSALCTAAFSNPKYNIVGHSLGGKIALMVAAKYDRQNVNVIIAMDPVDSNPQELTYPITNPKTNLNNSRAHQIHLFQSEKGVALAPLNKNATAIKNIYGNKITSLTVNEGAGHMSYCDTERDYLSKDARDSVQQKIDTSIKKQSRPMLQRAGHSMRSALCVFGKRSARRVATCSD